ncbi:hypothetical protein R75461_07250 [Paraburkholderia nemoris]|nr:MULTISPECIES: hypothetical protein [Paraburkholderia]CAE6846163.1 hypothetical protein R75461_07250 [Paraburkholderia nemoris]
MKNPLAFAALLDVVHASPVEVVHNLVTFASVVGVLPSQLVSQ